MSTVTFVTALFVVKDYKQPGKSTDLYFEHFMRLVNTGIQLSVYISPIHFDRIKKIVDNHQNVKISGVFNLNETWTYKTTAIQGVSVPSNRNLLKDTFDYFVCQSSKLECLQDTIKQNPFGTDYFAWIDFGVYAMLKDIESANKQLQLISTSSYVKDKVIFPGCWQKGHYNYLHGVIWVLAGAFFIGYKDAFLNMWERYQIYLPQFIKNYNLMTWEVNLWVAMQIETDWDFHWYYGDHNNSLLNISTQYFI